MIPANQGALLSMLHELHFLLSFAAEINKPSYVPLCLHRLSEDFCGFFSLKLGP